MLSLDLFANAVAAGILLGGFYAAVAIGLAVSFGQLDIVNIAHPAFIVAGSYIAWALNRHLGLDPVLIGLLASPLFFLAGALVYRVYYAAFERTGQESLSGLAFFFGLMFVIEVVLILAYGVDYRLVTADYIGRSIRFADIELPLRLLVPFAVALALTGGIWLYLGRTFTGRAILAVAQDRLALQLMGADPVRVKQLAFGLAIATAAVAGALLVVIGPVEPSLGRAYIGRAFAIVVLGGMGSIGGMFIAALMLGVVESLVATFVGPSWSPAVSFGVLLLTLAIRPSGLYGRK
ncbi:MAG TPA: branched-chain amino acid ABC transporter permease [Burkholderiales bacterium]|nr:branched-chain amino acid ABC transporter permease [Burkholderiales bacterium]